MIGFNKYKSKLSQAFINYEDADRKELMRALDRAIIEVRKREERKIFKEETLQCINDLELEFAFDSEEALYKTNGNEIKIAACLPSWWNGWSKISKKDNVSDIIDSEFHFIVQYVFRAYKLNLAVALSLNECGSIEFFSAEGRCAFFDKRDEKNYKNNFFDGVCSTQWEVTEGIKETISKVNCLDPNINKIVYYYLESKKLNEKGFWRSAITDLQSTVDSIVAYLRGHNKVSGETSWQDVLKSVININDESVLSLENLYELRNCFSAHPAHAKWWDFAELYDEVIDNCFIAVKKLLIETFNYENKNRVVVKNPKDWSKWYENHMYIIADAIGFEKLPIIHYVVEE